MDGYGTPSFVQKEHRPGGALYDMGVYHIAKMLYLLGNPHGRAHHRQDLPGDRHGPRPAASRAATTSRSSAWASSGSPAGSRWTSSRPGRSTWTSSRARCIVGSQGGIRLNPFGFFHSVGDLDLNSTVDLKGFD